MEEDEGVEVEVVAEEDEEEGDEDPGPLPFLFFPCDLRRWCNSTCIFVMYSLSRACAFWCKSCIIDCTVKAATALGALRALGALGAALGVKEGETACARTGAD